MARAGALRQAAELCRITGSIKRITINSRLDGDGRLWRIAAAGSAGLGLIAMLGMSSAAALPGATAHVMPIVSLVVLAAGLAGWLLHSERADAIEDAAHLRNRLAESQARNTELERRLAQLTGGPGSPRGYFPHVTAYEHEVRTRLNTVIGFADATYHEVHGALSNPRYRDYARHISESGRGLLGLMEDGVAHGRAEAQDAARAPRHRAW